MQFPTYADYRMRNSIFCYFADRLQYFHHIIKRISSALIAVQSNCMVSHKIFILIFFRSGKKMKKMQCYPGLDFDLACVKQKHHQFLYSFISAYNSWTELQAFLRKLGALSTCKYTHKHANKSRHKSSLHASFIYPLLLVIIFLLSLLEY